MSETYSVTLPNGEVITKQLPAGASNKQVRTAFERDMAKLGINVNRQQVQRPEPQGNAMLTAYEPTYAEKLQGAIAGFLTNVGVDERYAHHVAGRLGGALRDLTPAGNVTDFLDADTDFERQLAILPLPGPLKKELKAGIRAWHGSPHDFDKFSLSKIGTGEGAQAYGHGLYFAENPEVAKEYREQLTRNQAISGGFNRAFVANGKELPAADRAIADLAHMAQQYESDIIKDYGSVDAWFKSNAGASGIYSPAAAKRFTELRATPLEVVKHRGRLYEVNINAEPEDFLDWDAPLSGQSDDVRKAFETIVHPDVMAARQSQIASGDFTGAGVMYSPLGMDSRNAARASEAWRGAGIPGIRYLDQGSRGAGHGSRNYVLFDDSLVNILAKY